MLHIPSGTYLRLEGSAGRIIELLGSEPDVAKAAAALSEEFNIPSEVACRDVESVIAAIASASAPRTTHARIPTLKGIGVVTGDWWRQPLGLRLAIVRASLVVAAVEVGLRIVDIGRLSRVMGVPLATDAAPLIPNAVDDLTSLSEREARTYIAVNWVMRRWSFDGTCLRRALTHGWFVRRHKPRLRLGMISGTDMTAHAWIEFGGVTIGSQPVSGTFSLPGRRGNSGPQ